LKTFAEDVLNYVTVFLMCIVMLFDCSTCMHVSESYWFILLVCIRMFRHKFDIETKDSKWRPYICPTEKYITNTRG